jgi:hypothetical protein
MVSHTRRQNPGLAKAGGARTISLVCSRCQGTGTRTSVDGKWLREQREEQGLKRAAVAAAMGVSEPFLYLVETNKRAVSENVAGNYIDALHRIKEREKTRGR